MRKGAFSRPMGVEGTIPMSQSATRILLVEDDRNDVELVMNAFEEQGLADRVDVVSDGQMALDYLNRTGHFADRTTGSPAVVFLDLKLPRIDGLEVLRRIRGDEALKTTPVVMLTSSQEVRDLAESYGRGVNAYVVKPVHFDEYLESLKRTGAFWGGINQPPPADAGRYAGSDEVVV